jgi:putative transposase
MTANPSIDPARFLHDQLAVASPDLLRELATFIGAVMVAEADAICGAPYGVPSSERSNSRSGYRHRDFDTRAGTLDVAIPKLRSGSYFPDWLLERRRRAERALTTVVATCYLLGVSTGRMEKLVESLGITRLSKSQVSVKAADLDEQVNQFLTRPLDAGPYTFVAMDALVLKVREGGRVVNVHGLVATGVNGDGHREILGLQVSSAEDGAGWLGLLRSDRPRSVRRRAGHRRRAHRADRGDRAPTLPGGCWQRCRTHYAANLMSVTPNASWPWVKTLLHSVYDQPDKDAVHAQFDRVLDALADKLPAVVDHLEAPTCSPSLPSRRRSGARSGRTTHKNGSTERSAAAPTWSASSPTATPCSASSAPCSPNSTTTGSRAAATSASTSSPRPASPSSAATRAPPRRWHPTPT